MENGKNAEKKGVLKLGIFIKIPYHQNKTLTDKIMRTIYMQGELVLFCDSRTYPYSTHRRDWNFLAVQRFCKTRKFKEMSQACQYLEFPEGWGWEF